MIRKLLTWALIAALAVGTINWLAKPGNGKMLGSTAGNAANKGGDAVGGAADGFTYFFRNLTK